MKKKILIGYVVFCLYSYIDFNSNIKNVYLNNFRQVATVVTDGTM